MQVTIQSGFHAPTHSACMTIQSLNECWAVWVFTDSCSGSYMDDIAT